MALEDKTEEKETLGRVRQQNALFSAFLCFSALFPALAFFSFWVNQVLACFS